MPSFGRENRFLVKTPPFLRYLNPPETALTFCNEKSPLLAVIVIRFRAALSPTTVEEALLRLQARHTLLQAGIAKSKGAYVFTQIDPSLPIPFRVVRREDSNSWQKQTENALNSTFDTNGPLLHCIYLEPDEKTQRGEILLILHHAIIDGVGARLILLDFLQICGGQTLREIPFSPKDHKTLYPAPYLGLRGLWRKINFGGRQLLEELMYLYREGQRPVPAHSQNAVISIKLDADTSANIIEKAGKAGLTLNSVIGAALLQALFHCDHDTDAAWLRAIAFADLRPRLSPPVSTHELGCFLSMPRFTVRVAKGDPLFTTARNLREKMFAAGKNGDLYFFSLMMPTVVKMAWSLEQFRVADTALSYLGTLNVRPSYGDMEIDHISAFIGNSRLGPRLSAFGMCLFGKIGIDLNFLTSEFEREKAEKAASYLKKLLEEIR